MARATAEYIALEGVGFFRKSKRATMTEEEMPAYHPV